MKDTWDIHSLFQEFHDPFVPEVLGAEMTRIRTCLPQVSYGFCRATEPTNPICYISSPMSSQVPHDAHKMPLTH